MVILGENFSWQLFIEYLLNQPNIVARSFLKTTIFISLSRSVALMHGGGTLSSMYLCYPIGLLP